MNNKTLVTEKVREASRTISNADSGFRLATFALTLAEFNEGERWGSIIAPAPDGQDPLWKEDDVLCVSTIIECAILAYPKSDFFELLAKRFGGEVISTAFIKGCVYGCLNAIATFPDTNMEQCRMVFAKIPTLWTSLFMASQPISVPLVHSEEKDISDLTSICAKKFFIGEKQHLCIYILQTLQVAYEIRSGPGSNPAWTPETDFLLRLVREFSIKVSAKLEDKERLDSVINILQNRHP